MEFQTPKVTFTLKALDISASNLVADYPLTNIKGSISEFRTTITWNAINIKNLLGELYNHYDLFNIQLVNTGWALSPAYGVTANDRGVNVVMSGLDWTYNNYNTLTGNMTNECIVGVQFLNPPMAANVGVYNGLLQNATFRKCITADITIAVETVLGGVPNLAAGSMYPQLSYSFIVTPVEY